MRTADELADRRFDNAEAAGRLAEMSRNIGKQKDRLIQLFKRQETLTQEGGRLDADWRALWDTAPFDPLVPDAMLEWLEARNELMEAIELRAEATGKLEVQRKEELEAKESLSEELSSLGTDRATWGNATLPVILERADSVRREHEQKAEVKARLDKSLQEAATHIGRRCRELARSKQAWSRWEEGWAAALTGLGLATGSNPDDVSARIDIIDQMREKGGRKNDRIDSPEIELSA